MRTFNAWTSALLALVTTIACGATTAADKPIRIGAIVSATGPASFLGDPEQKTLEMYVQQLNDAGGVVGRKLELVLYDDASDANRANSFTRRLLIQDEADAVIGASTTGSTMAMAPQIDAATTPTISLAGASVIVEPVKPWLFKVPHSDRMASQKVLEDIKKRGFSRIALLSDTGGFGKSARVETLKLAESMAVEIVEDQQYGEKDADMTPQLAKIKSSPAQVILVLATGQAPAIIARNVQQLAITQALYMTHGQASLEFVRLAGKASEGIRMPAPALMVASALAQDDPQRAVSLAYIKSYEGRFHVPVSTFGGYAHDALLMLVDAIKRAGSADKAKVRTALEQTSGFVCVSGIYRMSASDHMGLPLSAFRMVEVRNGTFVEIR